MASTPISVAARPLTNGTAAAAGSKLVDFLNKAVTPFHAVAEVVSRLNAAGYTALEEGAEWPELTAGAKHYVVRNQSSVVAFALGGKFQQGSGFKIIGAHTDSPNLALKPQTKSSKHGFEHVGVQLYGGGLWHTWFDRDLTVAGRILVKDGATKLKSKLVHVPRPILRIPNLAIHLQSAAERESFAPNKESHTSPLLGTSLAESVSSQLLADTPENQSKGLFSLIATTAGVTAADIVDFDLSIVDTQPAAVGGAYNEFVWGPRIDNLFSCFTGVEALVATDGSLAAEEGVRMIAFFDHEEVGSESTHGAAGSLIPDLVDRIQKEHRARSVANSILLSVDCAHGCHPNYADKHEAVNRPSVQAGPVIKYNANQRYATNGHTAAWLAAVAALADVPVQKFAVKNDSPCGTTIGPILSSLSGIKAADIGAPMLSMHSIREMCGTADIVHMTNLLTAFFERSAEVVMEN